MIRQAVILAGGLGTRLGALTAETPKPMVQVAGAPFLDYLVDVVSGQGFNRILLLTGYKGDVIAGRYDGMQRRGATISCLREDAPLGTGGALRAAAGQLDDAFILMNGDTFFDINLCHLASDLEKKGGDGVIALRAAQGDRYGTVAWDGDVIRSFAARGQGSHINGGVYALRKDILAAIGQGPVSLEADVFPDLAMAGRLRGTAFDRFFIDIGIPAALAEAQVSVPAQMRRPALFFDRDGVLNIDTGYVYKPEDFIWRDGAIESIRRLNDAGWWVIVVTNQAGVARGYYGEAEILHLHAWMNEELAHHGARINTFYYCPHHPEGKVAAYTRTCSCRKPGIAMLEQARAEWQVAGEHSLLIGDKDSDVEAAVNGGVPARLIGESDNLLAIVDAAIQAARS